MNFEIELLSSRVQPLIDELAQGNFELGSPPSELLAQFYEQDDTAKYLFDSYVASKAEYKNTGVFVITNAQQLEKIYRDPPLRGKELIENRIFVFAIDGDGSFFGFCLDDRVIYHFDFCQWVGEEGSWSESVSNQWDVAGFCEYFENEFAANRG